MITSVTQTAEAVALEAEAMEAKAATTEIMENCILKIWLVVVVVER